jgi:hypothetical protein
MSKDTVNAILPCLTAFSTKVRTRTIASIVDRPLRKLYWCSCSLNAPRNRCASRRAATILSSSLPASSNKHTGRKAEGKSGSRPVFGRRTIRPSLHRSENSPKARHLSNRCRSLEANDPATPFVTSHNINHTPQFGPAIILRTVVAWSPFAVVQKELVEFDGEKHAHLADAQRTYCCPLVE